MAMRTGWRGVAPRRSNWAREGVRPGAPRLSHRELLVGAAALVGLLLLVVGVPLVLLALAGNPLPTSVPRWESVRDALADGRNVPPGAVTKAVALVGWLAWIDLMRSVAAEGLAWLTARPAPPVRFGGVLGGMVRPLVAAVAVLFVAGARPPATAPVSIEAVAPLLAVEQRAETAPAPVSSRSDASPVPDVPTHLVVPGDTLWDIADGRLGEPFRYGEIFELTRGVPQGDGRTLEDPDEIEPGWVLRLPPDTIPPPTPPTAPAPSTSAPSRAAPGLADHGGGPPTSVPDSERPDDARPPAAASPTPEDTEAPHPPLGLPLPSGSYVAVELAVAAAGAFALAARRRRRRWRPGSVGPGIRYEDDRLPPTATRLAALMATLGPRAVEPSPPSDPELARVAVAEGDGTDVVVDLLEVGALVLDGAAARGVARALIASLAVARGGVGAEVVLVGGAAQHLFPTGVPRGLHVVPDADAAVTDTEADLLRRARLLDTLDATSLDALRQGHPEEPLAARVLVVVEGEADALVELAHRGGQLGVGALVVGGDGAARVEVGTDGTLVAASFAPLSGLSGARLFRLEESEAQELLSALEDPRSSAGQRNAEAPFVVPRPVAPDTAALRARLLGPYAIEACGDEVRRGLRSKARELLAFFLVRPDGASMDAAIDALFPDVDLDQGSTHFWAALANLRTTLRKATGDPDLKLIDKVGDRYRVDPACIDCDLWRFEVALAATRDADDDAVAAATLTEAMSSYGGELLAGAFYSWVDPPREDLRRRAIDAFARLADLREAQGDTEGALVALDRAVEVDPYAEELYRRLMRLQARLGRPTIRATYQRLEARLAELDVDPEPETVALAESLARPHRDGDAATTAADVGTDVVAESGTR